MSATRVPRPAAPGNPDLAAARAAIMAAAAKVAAEELDKSDLAEGSAAAVRLTISAEVGELQFCQRFDCQLTVGHASTRASSTGPNQDHLLAVVLSKLNAATRERILRELPAEFAAAGELPELPAEDIEAARELRAELRQKVNQQVSAPVRVNYSPAVELAVAPAPAAAPAARAAERRPGELFA